MLNSQFFFANWVEKNCLLALNTYTHMYCGGGSSPTSAHQNLYRPHRTYIDVAKRLTGAEWRV